MIISSKELTELLGRSAAAINEIQSYQMHASSFSMSDPGRGWAYYVKVRKEFLQAHLDLMEIENRIQMDNELGEVDSGES